MNKILQEKISVILRWTLGGEEELYGLAKSLGLDLAGDGRNLIVQTELNEAPDLMQSDGIGLGFGEFWM